MTTTPDSTDDHALDAAFAALRAAAPAPSERLVARVLADAAAARPVARPKAGLGARLRHWLGRHAVAGGLAAAATAGFAVGLLAPPAAFVAPDAAEIALIPDAEAFALLETGETP